jgi:hypothetical protein
MSKPKRTSGITFEGIQQKQKQHAVINRMKFIYAALAAALSFVTGGSQREKDLVSANEALTSQNTDLTNNLTTLHGAFDELKTADDATKAALEQSKADLKTSQDAAAKSASDFADLQAQVDDAGSKSQTLISAISGITGIPINVNDDGTINHDTDHPANDTRAPGASEVPATPLPTDPDAPVTNDPTPAPQGGDAQQAAGSGSPGGDPKATAQS